MKNNNTSSICLMSNTEFDVIIWQTGAFVFPILVIPGHLIMLFVMISSNRRRSQPTTLYVIGISITQSIYLVFMFWDWLDAVDLPPDSRQILNCAFYYAFVSRTGFISLFLRVQLNLDRISIIHQPQTTYLYITHKRIFIKIIFTFSTLLLCILHYHFSLHYDSQSFIIFGQSYRVYKHAHTWFYSIWSYVQLFFRVISCLMIISCTIYVFYNRCYQNSDRSTCLHRQQKTFSLVLVLLRIYTFLAVIPIAILQIFNQYMWKHQMECFDSHWMKTIGHAQRWRLLYVICIMWEASIYMIKFYIKSIFSSEFRNDIKRLIFC